MSKKQVNDLLLLLLVSAFLSAGCAHENRQITTAKAEQVPSAPGTENDPDDDLSDDEFDLFDDEFEKDKVEVADPMAIWNRGIFHFNDKFYFWILKPVARGYRAVVPSTARTGVRNFFSNLTTPARLANCILQWKWQAAGAESVRFLLNSTIGVIGFGNPAKKHPELNLREEDLGQTLGVYGIGNGFYVVWPFLGPSTLRDSVGLVGDYFLNPIFFVKPLEAAVVIKTYEIVNDTSFEIGDYESFKKAAINPYEALRDAYIQHRKSKVKK
ncbi:MAG: VacJ family lipoprotein [Desulfobacterales bacterium]|nr:VacJ family lipoprotein [Desulfobacterales bacterium]